LKIITFFSFLVDFSAIILYNKVTGLTQSFWVGRTSEILGVTSKQGLCILLHVGKCRSLNAHRDSDKVS